MRVCVVLMGLSLALAACGEEGPEAAQDYALAEATEELPGASYSMRFDTVIPMCSVALLDSGKGCPSDDEKCLCKPEIDALNTPKGSPGNPKGKVILISQPEYGPRGDGSYALDMYAAIKSRGNRVGHYVNELNPSLSCSAGTSWSGVACGGSAGCGWRCIAGSAYADAIIDEIAATYADRAPPSWIALNEAWSLLYRDDDEGVAYRTWIRNLTRRLADRGKRPLLFVQERHITAGPYTLLADTARYAWFAVEGYLSGREVVAAPGQCAPPYDDSNWCTREYAEIRRAFRESADPPIPYSRMVMVEHFATNTYQSSDGLPRGWGRAYDVDPQSPKHGTPTTHMWQTVIQRRARAVKALPNLGGVSSYLWAGNGSGTGSSYRVAFAETYSAVPLP